MGKECIPRGMGAEAIKELLEAIDLERDCEELSAELRNENTKGKSAPRLSSGLRW